MVEVVSGHTELRRARRALAGPVPVPRRAHALVLGRPDREALLLLRLPGGRQHLHLPRGEGGPRLPRRGRTARGPLRRRARVRHRRPAATSAAARASGCSSCSPKTATFYARYLWDSEEAAARARPTWRARPRPRGAEEFGVGYAPSAWDRVLMSAQQAGFTEQELQAAGLAAAGQAGRHLRPLPGPDHVPAARRPRPGARLRRARDARRPAAEVRELVREAGLPQGPLAVRAGPRAAARDARRAGARGRGLHRRAGPAPGRFSQRGRVDGHGAHRRAGGRAGAARAGGRAGLRRRPLGPGGHAARAARRAGRGVDLKVVAAAGR